MQDTECLRRRYQRKTGHIAYPGFHHLARDDDLQSRPIGQVLSFGLGLTKGMLLNMESSR
jgi:hypothetical protein